MLHNSRVNDGLTFNVKLFIGAASIDREEGLTVRKRWRKKLPVPLWKSGKKPA
jgi:hypothetical protein